MRYLPIYLLALIATGCCSRCKNDTATRYHEDGRAKPVVALPAMIDTTSFDVPWSISDELTSQIVQTISKGAQVFIQSRDDFAIASNPFTGELSWMKREFENQEFAVFLELAEHELVSVSKGSTNLETSQNLNVGIRIRVIDLRGAQPKVVLQEMVRESYYIPRTLFPVDYNTVTWGSAEYPNSSMGVAHAHIVQEVAARIAEYVLLAKSR